MLYEVMTAFFLEAESLGIMLFGQKRVGKRLRPSPEPQVGGSLLGHAPAAQEKAMETA